MVDIVTERHANMHNEIVRLMEGDRRFQIADESTLYAVAYRPVRRDERQEGDHWPVSLRVGEPLPTLPLYVRWDLGVLVELEATYLDACRRRRLI